MSENPENNDNLEDKLQDTKGSKDSVIAPYMPDVHEFVKNNLPERFYKKEEPPYKK